MAEGKIGWPGLLAALEAGDEQTTRKERRMRRFITIAFTVSCLMTITYIVWTLSELRDAWHTGVWTYFWTTVNGVWPAVGLSMRALPTDDSLYSTAARKIREVALSGDEQHAPLAVEQSQPSQGDGILFGGVPYGPLRQPHDGRTVGPILAICLTVFMAVIFGGVLLAAGVSDTSKEAILVEAIFGSVALFLLMASIWPLLVVLRMRRDITVVADDAGITWKQIGWRTHSKTIAWHDAQAFFIITRHKSTNWTADTTWVLMGSSRAFAWTAPQDVTSQIDTPHARFAALVAARTRLPVRDLSIFTNQLVNPGLTTEQRKAMTTEAITVMKEARAHPERAEAWLSTHRSGQTTEPSRLRWGCAVQLVLLIAIALLYAGGWGLQQYQSHYYAGLRQEIHTEKPLYHDHLGADNGDWPVRTSTSDAPRSFSYSNDSYHMTSTAGQFVAGWTSDIYGGAAIEATVRQIGRAQNAGVGLILHTFDDNSFMTVFYIYPADGTWCLAHFRDVSTSASENWRDLDYGSSRSIHTEAGAANHLLVIMAGDRYLCYINGSLVLSYDDSEHVTPRTGHIGLYLNDGAVEGVFNDFTVYPAPPPLPFSTI